MAIHSFLKAERGDPDWQFSPEDYYGKEFKIIDANMIELDEERADLVVLRQTPTEKDLLAKHLRITLQKGSTLELMILNDVDPNLQQVFLYDVYLKSDSTLLLGLFVKEGKLNKHIFQIHLEDGANFTNYGLISNTTGGDSEVITKVVHKGEESISNQLYLGIAGEKSQVVYQGIAIAESTAFGSQIGIENANLVIAPGGRCYSKPETYIETEDVTSKHSSETSTISMEKIGYLQSKGLTESEAIELIISGFRNQVIDIINTDSIKQEVKELFSSD